MSWCPFDNMFICRSGSRGSLVVSADAGSITDLKPHKLFSEGTDKREGKDDGGNCEAIFLAVKTPSQSCEGAPVSFSEVTPRCFD